MEHECLHHFWVVFHIATLSCLVSSSVPPRRSLIIYIHIWHKNRTFHHLLDILHLGIQQNQGVWNLSSGSKWTVLCMLFAIILLKITFKIQWCLFIFFLPLANILFQTRGVSKVDMVQCCNRLPKSHQGYGFSSGHVWMRELDCKESWASKNGCFWTVLLEKTLESPLDCKEIQPVHPKGDQSWVFIGRTDAEAETSILRPTH